MMTIDQVKEQITAVRFMHQLDPVKFAEPDGMADSLAQRLGKDALKATQLRRVFQDVKSLDRKIRNKSGSEDDLFKRANIAKLIVNLAYVRGRDLIPKDFYDILMLCLDQKRLQVNKDFLQVADFIEAILAYHKFRYPKGGS